MEVVTRLPGGDVIVFVLAILIAVSGVRGPALGDAQLLPREPATAPAAA